MASFMFPRTSPVEKEVAMVLIGEDASEDEVRVKVSLPQYGNLSASLLFKEEERYNIIRGRMVAAKVKEAALGEIDLIFVRDDAEHHKLYTEQLHVRAVLRHLAGAVEISVEDLYRQLDWPTYSDLAGSDVSFWLSVPEHLRAPLLESTRKVQISTWRIKQPAILSTSPIKQSGTLCYVVSLIWQYEAFLKRHEMLDLEESLSIQDFIDRLAEEGLIHQDGVEDLNDTVSVLRRYGSILSRDGPPLTFVADTPTPRRENIKLFLPSELNILMEVEDYTDVSKVDIYRNWNTRIRQRLDKDGPLCASVTWYPSFTDQLRLTNEPLLLQPSQEEFSKFVLDSYSAEASGTEDQSFSHTLLLSGHGKDELERLFFESKDPNGDADNGDRGFLRHFAGETPLLVLDYVHMELDI